MQIKLNMIGEKDDGNINNNNKNTKKKSIY